MNVIEVYADIWCPFTHVGLKRVVARATTSGTPIQVRAHAWPLELVNGRPVGAAFVAEEVAELRAGVAPDLFEGFDESRFPTTTLPALALAESAYAVGGPVGQAMSLALRDALFEFGLDISDPAVLADLAADLSVPSPGPEHADAVRAGWDAGKARGVIGSPHFVTSAGGFFCPALDIERVDGHLRISTDEVGFEAFIVSCLGR
jgi:predicted DsbA family dithiol-disulfide isomerase